MSMIINSRSAVSRPGACLRNSRRVHSSLSKLGPRILVTMSSMAATSGNNLNKQAEASANSGEVAAHSQPDHEAQDAAPSAPPVPLPAKKGAITSGVLPFNLGELNRKTAAREAAQARLRNLPTLFSDKDASIDM